MYQTAVAIESYQQNGEDRVEVIESPNGLVIVVVDGVGGRAGGGVAADLTVISIQARVHALPDKAWRQASWWADLLTKTDTIISTKPEAGMTTCVVIAVNRKNGSLLGASVGDSEAWVVTPDDWIELTEHQMKFGKSYLGRSDAVGVPFSFSLTDGSTLLVATDGLFKYADADKICAAVRQDDLDAAVRDLIGLVRFPNGGLPDDIAVVLCRPA